MMWRILLAWLNPIVSVTHVVDFRGQHTVFAIRRAGGMYQYDPHNPVDGWHQQEDVPNGSHQR